jgi:tRNA U34 5-methylaminomethyl-2-thiouridine-forming methyltransferase MnmC
MQRTLKLTEDGSHTIFVNDLDEPYHSIHGALQESMHVFIKQGLQSLKAPSIRILEVGFGTGLNALLTLSESIRLEINIYYHAVEKYPLADSEYKLLNFENFIPSIPKGILHEMHTCPWGKPEKLSEQFSLFKEKADFRQMHPPAGFNLVYFDAFSPDKQPELWTSDVFNTIARVTDPEAILVTYSSKGIVRRTLNSCGFDVHKVAGPPGKREMIKAIKR